MCTLIQVQILNKKVDLSKVTSKCGSKDNIKHKPGQTDNSCALFSFMLLSSSLVNSIPFYSHINLFLFAPGGGDVKIESHKINIKAKSKIGSLDNVGLETGNGHANGHVKV